MHYVTYQCKRFNYIYFETISCKNCFHFFSKCEVSSDVLFNSATAKTFSRNFRHLLMPSITGFFLLALRGSGISPLSKNKMNFFRCRVFLFFKKKQIRPYVYGKTESRLNFQFSKKLSTIEQS